MSLEEHPFKGIGWIFWCIIRHWHMHCDSFLTFRDQDSQTAACDLTGNAFRQTHVLGEPGLSDQSGQHGCEDLPVCTSAILRILEAEAAGKTTATPVILWLVGLELWIQACV